MDTYNWRGAREEGLQSTAYKMGEVQKLLEEDPGKYSSFSMYLRLDNVKTSTQINKHKAIDLLIDLGGLQKSLAGIFVLITVVISKKLFMTDILGSLYLVKRYDQTTEKD